MVPGMTERDRLASDVRLCEWLAESRLGPTLTAVSPMGRVTASGCRPELLFTLVRRGIAVARALRQRIRPMQPGAAPNVIRGVGLNERGGIRPMGDLRRSSSLLREQAQHPQV